MCDGAYHHVSDENGYRELQERIVLSTPFILDHIPINELEKAHARRSRERLFSPNLVEGANNDNNENSTGDDDNINVSVNESFWRK